MIYCDLSLNGVYIWTGRPCLNGVYLRVQTYYGPIGGDLMFMDTQGSSNPTWDGLGARYQLVWFPDSSTPASNVPLQAVPAQQLDVLLGSITYTLCIYENSPS